MSGLLRQAFQHKQTCPCGIEMGKAYCFAFSFSIRTPSRKGGRHAAYFPKTQNIGCGVQASRALLKNALGMATLDQQLWPFVAQLELMDYMPLCVFVDELKKTLNQG